MPIEIRIPRLGWSMEEGTFVRWRKSDGDTIRPGDILFELEGEKATQDIEAVDAGILRIPANGPKPGEVVSVGAVVGFLVSENELPGTLDVSPTSATGNRSSTAVARSPVSESGQAMSANAAAPLSAPREESVAVSRPASSPRARRAARELGIDWTTLRGTGARGRVRERDVLAAATTGVRTEISSTDSQQAVPLSSIRKSTAEGMVLSLRTAAHVTLSTTVDVTELIKMRQEWKQAAIRNGTSAPTLNDAIVKLAAKSLAQHPTMNSRWEGNRIVLLSQVNIGIAVDCEHGLLVPVIHNVTRMQLEEIASRSQELIERARAKRLDAAELRGGTFTVSNLGMFGIDMFTPILRPGETAILGVGAVRRQPVVVDADRIVPRDVMTLNLSFDHRVVDGVPAARFLNSVRLALENAAQILAD